MHEINKIGFVVVKEEGGVLKVLLAKTKPGQWRFPELALPVGLSRCDKEAAEPCRQALVLGKSTYVSTIYSRDARESGIVTRFFALRCSAPEAALASVSYALDCETRWASFEEASWVVVPSHLEVADWAERLVTPKPPPRSTNA